MDPPAFAHLPLILNADGSKMSKRDQGAAVHEYAERGFLPPAVVNFTALLGWSPKDDAEVLSTTDLVDRFSLEGVNRSPSRFDWDKCQWLNQQHLMALQPAAFAEEARPYVESAGLRLDGTYPAMAASVQEKVRLLTEVPDAIEFYFAGKLVFDDEALARVRRNEEAPSLLRALAGNLASLADWSGASNAIATTAAELGAKPGQLMFPLRVALSGRSAGPALDDMLAILGREESIRRIEHAARELEDDE